MQAEPEVVAGQDSVEGAGYEWIDLPAAPAGDGAGRAGPSAEGIGLQRDVGFQKIGRAQDAGEGGDALTAEGTRVAAAVPVLVARGDDIDQAGREERRREEVVGGVYVAVQEGLHGGGKRVAGQTVRGHPPRASERGGREDGALVGAKAGRRDGVRCIAVLCSQGHTGVMEKAGERCRPPQPVGGGVGEVAAHGEEGIRAGAGDQGDARGVARGAAFSRVQDGREGLHLRKPEGGPNGRDTPGLAALDHGHLPPPDAGGDLRGCERRAIWLSTKCRRP